MTPAFLEAVLDSDLEGASRALGTAVPEEWLDEARRFRLRLMQLRHNPDLQPWLARGMVLREAKTMIGQIGFHTAPGPDYLSTIAPGGIEYGYVVLPLYRRQGYAREAAAGLMEWARENHGVVSFVLSIRPDNLPSRRLAEGLGFVVKGHQVDEEDGPEDIYVRTFEND